MTPEQRLTLTGCLLSAIVLASNALWYHYQEADLRKKSQAPNEDEKDILQKRSRWAGMLFSLLQVTLFIMNPVAREQALSVGIVALAGTIFLQGLFQTHYETKLRGQNKPTKMSPEFSKTLFGPIGFLVVNAVVFFMITQSVIIAAFVMGRALGVTGWSWLAVLSVSLASGVGAALWALHRSLPLQLAWLFRAKHCDRAQLRTILSHLQPDAVSLLRSTEILSCEFDRVFASPGAIAWMRKPGNRSAQRIIFIDRRMLSEWTTPELAAVLAHEAVHLQSSHAGSRFRELLRTAVGTFLIAGVVVAAVAPMGGLIAQAFTVFAACAVVAIPSIRLRQLVEKQELEADHEAVDRLGAEPAALMSALDKLEALQPIWQTSPTQLKRLPGTSANRLTALRMLRLREKINQRNAAHAESASGRQQAA